MAGAAMSATYPVNELRDELVCPICLEPFKDPVILDCEHNFCQACITDCWEASGTGVCPQCRRKSFPESELRPNKQLKVVVDVARRLQVELSHNACPDRCAQCFDLCCPAGTVCLHGSTLTWLCSAPALGESSPAL
uniref:RING-type domain-containing protein n=1 Tax=Chrysemys picta bellii TaxID=8478 RepID=A0A8C3P944_CHRPI